MGWENIEVGEYIVLEPEDWTPEQWTTLCELFGTEPDKTEVIRVELKRLDIFKL